jgi:hypothetical protein
MDLWRARTLLLHGSQLRRPWDRLAHDLGRPLGERSVGPCLVLGIRLTPSMRTTGAHDVRATLPARKRCRWPCMLVVVRPCCCISCCTALTLRRQQPNQRPSAFQAGHIPSWRESYESYALSPVADDSGWLLLLLSPLLSAVGSVSSFHGPPADSVTSWSSPPSPGLFPAAWPRPVLSQAPPPNPIAAEPDGRRVLSGGGVADHE